jgi:hypothetical protein
MNMKKLPEKSLLINYFKVNTIPFKTDKRVKYCMKYTGKVSEKLQKNKILIETLLVNRGNNVSQGNFKSAS